MRNSSIQKDRKLWVLGAALAVLVSVSTAAIACTPATSGMPSTSPAPGPAASQPVPTPTSTVLAAGAGAGGTPAPSSSTSVATLTVQQLKAQMDGKERLTLFDARPKPSYDSGHIPGAVSLPLSDLEKRLGEVPKDQLSVFYCSGATWGESYTAARELAAKGYTQVKVLYGGIVAWTEAGYPVEK